MDLSNLDFFRCFNMLRFRLLQGGFCMCNYALNKKSFSTIFRVAKILLSFIPTRPNVLNIIRIGYTKKKTANGRIKRCAPWRKNISRGAYIYDGGGNFYYGVIILFHLKFCKYFFNFYLFGLQ